MSVCLGLGLANYHLLIKYSSVDLFYNYNYMLHCEANLAFRTQTGLMPRRLFMPPSQ